MQYTGITKIGPWDLFQISDWEKQELKDMVAILPTLPPLNYENLNKRIGKLKEYPLQIPVAIIAIVLVVSTLFMVVTLVIIALVICKLRGNLKVLLPIGKIMIGKANSSETNQVRQALRDTSRSNPRTSTTTKATRKEKTTRADTRNLQIITEVNSALFYGYPKI